jgi:hypothetical protein
MSIEIRVEKSLGNGRRIPPGSKLEVNMIFRALLVFFSSIILSLFLMSGSEAKSDSGGVLLVTAMPKKAKFLRDGTRNGSIVAPSIYRVYLEHVKVIQGRQSKYPSSISVEMEANNINEVLGGYIYLLLNESLDNPRVIYWEKVISVACIPAEFVDHSYEDLYFDNPWGRSGMKCSFIKLYVPPPQDRGTGVRGDRPAPPWRQ